MCSTVYGTVLEMQWATIRVWLISAELWLLFLHSGSSIKEPHSLCIQDKRLWKPYLGFEEADPLTSTKYNCAYDLIGETWVSYDCWLFLWEMGKILIRTFWSLKNFGSPSVSEDWEALFPATCNLSNNSPVLFAETTYRMFAAWLFGGLFKLKV